jgi:hypothetical protein
MAVSKSTRRSTRDTNQPLREIFQKSPVSKDREQAWIHALLHSETGDPPLRFPVYSSLYLINTAAQQLVDALRTVSERFSIDETWSTYQQALVQSVRASASRNILATMAEIELTESWLFEAQCKIEEDRFRDPDEIYFQVREREEERAKQGFPPRIQFLDEELKVKPEPDSAESS